jgi:hypothetical protein
MRPLTPAEILQKIDNARRLWEAYRKVHTEAAPFVRREQEAYRQAREALNSLETVVRSQVAPSVEPFTHVSDGILDEAETEGGE